jgi:3-oxoadipate enol-lactonase
MHFRLSNGLTLAYRTRGAGHPLIFLHPIGTRGAFWDPVVERIAERYRCTTLDFRGHGGSDTPGTRFSLDDLAADVIELMRGERRHTVIIGCSLGGMVAQGIALKAPELVGGLVLAGTSHRQTPEGRKAVEQRAQDSLQGMPAMVNSTLARWFPAPFLYLNGPEVEACRHWLLEDDPVVFSWAWEAICDLDYGDRIADIAVPTLLLRGEVDASATRETMQAMAKLMPRGRYVEIEGAGHVAPLEQAEAFTEKLVEFLEHDLRG